MEQQTVPARAMGTMLFLVSLVSIAGFIALFTTVYNLGERSTFDTRALVAIMAFGGATVIGVIGLLVWLLLRLSTGHRPVAHFDQTAKPVLRDYNAQQLAAPPAPMSSVTENTTRNFEPRTYREKGVRE